MRKLANFLLIMVVLLLCVPKFGYESLSSCPPPRSVEQLTLEYNRHLAWKIQMYQDSCTARMLDSISQKSSIKRLLSCGLIETQIHNESGNNQDAVSPRGARGIAQFLPSTWQAMKNKKMIPSWFNIDNESHQRVAHLIYVDHLWKMWNGAPEQTMLMVASYNAGIGTIQGLVKTYGTEWRDYLPEETSKYLTSFNRYI